MNEIETAIENAAGRAAGLIFEQLDPKLGVLSASHEDIKVRLSRMESKLDEIHGQVSMHDIAIRTHFKKAS